MNDTFDLATLADDLCEVRLIYATFFASFDAATYAFSYV